jgi:hypothetical protein
VVETNANSGIFVAKYKVPKEKKDSRLKVSYGYFGLGVESDLLIK